MKLVVHSSSDAGVFAHINNQVLVCIWRRLDRVSWDAGAALLRDASSKQLVMFGVTEYGVKLPDSEFREASAAMLSKIDSRLVASATVILKNGLMGTAMRSVVTGVSLLSRMAQSQRTFSNIAEASAWIAPFAEQIGVPLSPAEFSRQLESFRSSRSSARI